MLGSETDGTDKVTHGFLVAVEQKVDNVTSPEWIKMCIQQDIERWGGKADVEYIGEIDCYEVEEKL